jgi:hypothetical protein
MASLPNIVLTQGENCQMTVVSDSMTGNIDLTTVIGITRATASFSGKIVAGATTIATTLKLDQGISELIRSAPLGTGIRARIRQSGEWVLITAITGQTATVTRGQVDPGGIVIPPAAAILANADIIIVPMDTVPVSAILDPADPTNKTALIEIPPDSTKVCATTYDFQITMQDLTPVPDIRIVFSSSKGNLGKLQILNDPNFYGA